MIDGLKPCSSAAAAALHSLGKIKNQRRSVQGYTRLLHAAHERTVPRLRLAKRFRMACRAMGLAIVEKVEKTSLQTEK